MASSMQSQIIKVKTEYESPLIINIEKCDNDVKNVDFVAHCTKEFKMKTEEIELGCDCIEHSVNFHADTVNSKNGEISSEYQNCIEQSINIHSPTVSKCQNSVKNMECYRNCALPTMGVADGSTISVSNIKAETIKIAADNIRIKEEPCDGDVENVDCVPHCAHDFKLKIEEIDLECDCIEHSLDLHENKKCENSTKIFQYNCVQSEEFSCSAVNQSIGLNTLKNKMMTQCVTVDNEAANATSCAGKFVLKMEEIDLGCDGAEQPAKLSSRTDEHNCDICEKNFSNGSNLKKHMSIHTGKKPHKCSRCEKKFSHAVNLKQHMLTHSNEKPYKCKICGWTFSHKNYLKRHILTHTGEKPHKCTVCEKNFSRTSTLKKHMLIHTEEKSHKCSVCENKFSHIDNLKQHMLTHSGEKPHKCNICEKQFSQKKHLNEHLLTHTDAKHHTCTLCEKNFARSSYLNKHMSTHTGKKSQKCKVCDRNFVSVASLNHHMVSHTGEKQHECIVCKKKFSQKKVLNVHMLTHTREKSHV